MPIFVSLWPMQNVFFGALFWAHLKNSCNQSISSILFQVQWESDLNADEFFQVEKKSASGFAKEIL